MPEISVLLFSYTYLHLIGYFQLLGVTPNANEYEIKKTYFELARKYHPSINSESPTVAAAATQAFQKIRQAYEDMLNALVDSMETTLSNENKNSPTSVDSNFIFKQPISTDADDECESQDEESPAQRGKNSCPKPTPESGQSFFVTPPHTPKHTFAGQSNNFFIFPEPSFNSKKSPSSFDTFTTPPTSPRLSPQEALILNQMSNLIPYQKKSKKKLK